jgi:hypothetical protein
MIQSFEHFLAFSNTPLWNQNKQPALGLVFPI